MVESHIEEVVYFFGLNVDKVPKMLSKHWIFLQNVETKEKPHLEMLLVIFFPRQLHLCIVLSG